MYIDAPTRKPKTYILPTLEDLVAMSYPEYVVSKVPLESLTLKEGSFSARYTDLRHERFFTPERFRSFIRQAQCSENLEFLIDIHMYEKLWNKTFHKRVSILSCNWIRVIPDGVDVTTVRREGSNRHKKSRGRSRDAVNTAAAAADCATPIVLTTGVSTPLVNTLNESLKNLDLNDVSSIVDVTKHGVYVNNSLSTVRRSDTEAHIIGRSRSNGSSSNTVNKSLAELWSNLICTYFKTDSIQELNLPNEVVRSVMSEDSKRRDHEPKVLVKSKKLILSLLRQNVYWKFIRSAEDEIQRESSGDQNRAFSANQKRRGPAGVTFNGTDEGVMSPDAKVRRASSGSTGLLRFYTARHATEVSTSPTKVYRADIYPDNDLEPSFSSSPDSVLSPISSPLSSPESYHSKASSVFALMPRLLHRKSHYKKEEKSIGDGTSSTSSEARPNSPIRFNPIKGQLSRSSSSSTDQQSRSSRSSKSSAISKHKFLRYFKDERSSL
ncbi:hypothetical protein FOA43_004555 [Brettanomyces nanus]|uniref:RGS domain-containing protein n=1 Tax=Eeniella nana TaxID=13502 RepID=A0A875RQJ2_EENNA|nr:uncharacterized protein FOA43_004555 [Brettanomyces nanus]QPG77150.1 hypothetical protein FOA43_004555 [Brettanomyces nanus]